MLGSKRGFARSCSSAANARQDGGGCGAPAPLLRRERVGPGRGGKGTQAEKEGTARAGSEGSPSPRADPELGACAWTRPFQGKNPDNVTHYF